MSHAYAVICPDELTLSAVSVALVAACIHGDAERVESGGYADVHFVPTDKDKVVTADIDFITSSAYITPTELDKKFYVIKHADTMNESAQNKLLKTLEEAPPSVCIVLECLTARTILPTVMSRSAKIEIPPFSQKELSAGLAEEYDGVSTDIAVGLSGGYFGGAERVLCDKSYAEDFDLAMDTLLCMKSSRNILTYSQLLMKKTDNLPRIIDCLGIILEDCMYYSSGLASKVKLKSKLRDITSLAEGYTYKCVALIMPILGETKRRLALYCNAQALVDSMLFAMLEVKAKCQK